MNAFSRFLTIIGTLLIVAAMVAHIICLATPNLCKMEFESYVKALNETLKELIASGQTESSMKLRENGEMKPDLFGEGGFMHFGIWTICLKGMMKTGSLDACFPWESAFPDEGTWEKPGWVKTVKGFYVAGLVVAVLTVILSNTNAHTPSQGDRGRILPFFICATSFLAGVILFIGNLIIVFNYSKDFKLPFFEKMDSTLRAMFEKVFESSFTVGWGFALDLTTAIVFLLAGLFHLLAGRAALREDKIRRGDELTRTPMPNYDDSPI